jgi:uncharacterized iron-regulated membrane protein
VSSYRLIRSAHKWVGIILSLVIIVISISGFLLLQKKNLSWLQPPTQTGAVGEPKDHITVSELYDAVLTLNYPDFQTLDDIDRIDFRPSKRIYKVRSNHNNSELQIDAITGEVLSSSVRRSDLLENIHDGSFFGDSAHGIILPISAAGLFFLSISGLIIWLQPILKKKRR